MAYVKDLGGSQVLDLAGDKVVAGLTIRDIWFTLSVTENNVDVGTLTAFDPLGGVLTWSITGGVDELLFEINSSSGLLSFVDPPDREDPLDDDLDNVYEVLVHVASSLGGSDEQLILVTVQDFREVPALRRKLMKTGCSA